MRRRAFLTNAPAAAFAATLPHAATSNHPDAELLRLEQEHVAAWAAVRKAWAEAGPDDDDSIEPSRLTDIADEIGQRIADSLALTFDGCQIKARAYERSDQFYFRGESVETDLLLTLVKNLIAVRPS